MLPLEHSAILLTFIKLLFVIKVIVLSIFEWLFYTWFTVTSDLIWDFGKLPFLEHLGKYFIKIGKVSA